MKTAWQHVFGGTPRPRTWECASVDVNSASLVPVLIASGRLSWVAEEARATMLPPVADRFPLSVTTGY